MCPISGESVSEYIAAHLFHPPTPFAETDPGGRVPEGLREAVLKALAKDPADRFAKAEELLEAIAPFQGDRAAVNDDLDQSLKDTTALLAEEAIANEGKPGSTQHRLDRNFAPVTTPKPSSLPTEATVPSVLEDDGKHKLDDLFANAQLLARLEQLDKAEHELLRVLEVNPDHTEARELLTSVLDRQKGEAEAALRREIGEENRRLASNLIAEARELLKGGKQTRAGEKLEEALALKPGDKNATALLAEVTNVGVAEVSPPATASDQTVVARVPKKRAAAAPSAPEAKAPSQPEARPLAEEALASIAKSLDAGDLDRAEEKLRFARERLGKRDDLAALEARLGAARTASQPAEKPDLADAPIRPDGDTEVALPVEEDPAPAKKKRGPWAIVALLLVAAVGAGAWWMYQQRSAEESAPTPAAVVVTGALVLDALPWAEVTVTDSEGAEVALPGSSYTPLRLELPPGEYSLSLSHPEVSEPSLLEVSIRASEVIERTVELQPLDADAFLESARR